MGMVWLMTRASDAQMAEQFADPSHVYDFVNSDEGDQAGRVLDLDKQWHAVHFLLTGSAGPTDNPLSLIVGRFEEIGPDNGYGAAWFIPKEALTAFDRALAGLTDEQWAARYDAVAAVAEQVYLAETLQDEGDEVLTFLADDIARLRAFVAAAVRVGDNAFAVIT